MSDHRKSPNPENSGTTDRQISRMAASLKDSGATPQRDLWPGIEKALDQVEQEARPFRTRNWPSAWQMAAVAASALLLVGLGYMGQLAEPGQDQEQAARQQPAPVELASATDEVGVTTLEKLDQTLRDLNQALQSDPDNRGLSRLVLLVHKSRANIMRQNTSGLNI